jgi:5-methylcytosine-specific restriction endonuclease McrA
MRKGKAKSGRKRTDIPRPHCGGQWTDARKRGFIISALRSLTMRWGPKYECVNAAFVRKGINPITGKPCKLHRCSICGELFPKGEIRADHILPVIDPATGFAGWDSYIERLLPEKEGFQAVCERCHSSKTAAERQLRSGALKIISAPRSRRIREK